MPQSVARKTYNVFVKGLITEATALTFPENASKDEKNMVLNRDGSRQRRKGMDYESGYALNASTVATTVQNASITVHEWKAAGANGQNNFAVVQIGATLHFYDLDNDSISANKKTFTVDLNSFLTTARTTFG